MVIPLPGVADHPQIGAVHGTLPHALVVSLPEEGFGVEVFEIDADADPAPPGSVDAMVAELVALRAKVHQTNRVRSAHEEGWRARLATGGTPPSPATVDAALDEAWEQGWRDADMTARSVAAFAEIKQWRTATLEAIARRSYAVHNPGARWEELEDGGKQRWRALVDAWVRGDEGAGGSAEGKAAALRHASIFTAAGLALVPPT